MPGSFMVFRRDLEIKKSILGSSHLFLHDADFLFLYYMVVTGKHKEITEQE